MVVERSVQTSVVERLRRSLPAVHRWMAKRELKEAWVCLEQRVAVRRPLSRWLDHLASRVPLWYWRDPVSGRVTLAFGTAWERRPEGEHRFQAARDALATVGPAVYAVDDARARWFAGFAFAPGTRSEPWAGWPDAWLWLPFCRLEEAETEVVVTFVVPVRRTGEEAAADTETLVHCTRLLDRMCHTDAQSPATSVAAVDGAAIRKCPDMSTWMETVAQCAAAIRGGSLEKVVLARSVQHHRPGGFDMGRAVEELEDRYPDAFVFAVCGSGGCFLGASPERLCGVREDQVFIDCLAGTRRRGQTPSEDELLAEQLMNSPKDRAEHEVVRRWIVNTVADITTDLTAPEVPQIKRLHNVQHLHTPISGQLCPGVGILDVAERLHPTPAVAGVPRSAALDWIRRVESFDRGWYAGALGWVEPQGDGEFAVALRSALVRGDEAVLFAGAGIMGDSDPRAEWEETGWKLHPMLSVLRLTELEASRR